MDNLESASDPRETRGPTRSRDAFYGRVFFALRDEYKLSFATCLLSDVIHTLSVKTGWCFASKAYLASVFGGSERSIQRSVSELVKTGLVERHNRKLRTTPQWRRLTGRT